MVQSVHRAAPLLQASGRGGSIINFTTIEAHRGAGTFAVYAGAKAAVENFTRAIAVEFEPQQIRVNTIVPDQTPSRGNMAALAGMGIDRLQDLSDIGHYFEEAIKLYIPMQAQPQPEDLADAVLFLASDLSKFITGTSLHVDGGCSACLGFLNWLNGDAWAPVPLGGTMPKMFDPPAKDRSQNTSGYEDHIPKAT